MVRSITGVVVWGVAAVVIAAAADPGPPQDRGVRATRPEAVSAPESQGMSAAGLARVTARLQQEVDAGRLSGAVALILRRGVVVYREAVGQLDRERDVPMRTDALFRIASMTKPVTSAGIMMLVEEGRLRLDDPVSRFIPEFAEPRILVPPPAADPTPRTEPGRREINVHHLLTHTSGLAYGFMAPEPLFSLYREAGIADGLSESSIDLTENARRLGRMPLLFTPGQQWNYSLSTDVLGRVIEVASGQPLDRFFRERIFDPLGMQETAFRVPPEHRDRFAVLYQPGEGQQIVRTPDVPQTSGTIRYSASVPLAKPVTFLSGGAGLVSTADDYARFAQMLLDRGTHQGQRLLRPETVRQMTTNQIGDLNNAFLVHGDKFGYGFGVATTSGLDEAGRVPAGTFGWGGIYNTLFFVNPRDELVAVLMTQLFPFDHLTLREDFQQLVCAAVIEPPESDSSRAGAAAPPHPAPGSVYREYARHNAGNKDWRVTDPQARAEGAQQHLPNPVLSLEVGDLSGAQQAEVLLDRWGGHVRTTAKQIRFNDHDWLSVPELSTTPAGQPPEMYYAQDNPVIPVPVDHLQTGTNRLEGTCSTIQNYNWGQWGLYSAILRVFEDPARTPHATAAITSPTSGATLGERPTIVVQVDDPADVSRVDVIAWYDGPDEDGDGHFLDWHEAHFQPERGAPAEIGGHVGSDTEPPFEIPWETSWVPDQPDGQIRLVARVQSRSGIWSVSPVVDRLSLRRSGMSVRLYRSDDVPPQFGVRADRRRGCTIRLPAETTLTAVQEAVLNLRTWHGDPSAHDWLQLNGQNVPLEGKNHHYDDDLLPVPVGSLRAGENLVEIYSRTEHHMLEILWPGPVLMVRARTD